MLYRPLITALLVLVSPVSGAAEARLFELEDFAWGLPLLEVERRAADHGYRLRTKEISGPELLLEYEASLRGMNCRLAFLFTPLGGKLYRAAASWDRPDFVDTLREELIREYGEPREELPGGKISIWTRRNTELILRAVGGETVLTYRHILLTREAREEKKIVKPKPEKRSALPTEDPGEETEDRTAGDPRQTRTP